MMPKSTAAMLPSARTNRLPACRSPWKKPSRNTCWKNAFAAVVSTRRGSWPAAMIAVALVDLDAADALGRQHALAGAHPVDRRHVKVGRPAKFSASSAAPPPPRSGDPSPRHRVGEGRHRARP